MKIIPAFKLSPIPISKEAKNLPKFKWAPEDIGTRYQLGGTPLFFQQEEVPVCPDCSEPMTFYGQLE